MTFATTKSNISTMKVVIFTLMTLALAYGATDDGTPVFASLGDVELDCAIEQDEIVVVASASAGMASIEYNMEVNSAYDNIFEIDDESGTVYVSQDKNYCKNRNQDFGMKIIAKNRENKKESSVNVNIKLREPEKPITLINIPDE